MITFRPFANDEPSSRDADFSTPSTSYKVECKVEVMYDALGHCGVSECLEMVHIIFKFRGALKARMSRSRAR